MNLRGIDTWLRPDESLGLNNCDREAIHTPGLIQPHGALAVFDIEGVVVQQSENLAAWVDFDLLAGIEEELGADGDEFDTRRRSRPVEYDGRSLVAVSHRLDGLRIVEFEASEDQATDSVSASLVTAFAELSSAKTPVDVFSSAVKSVAELIGFDRVMAYIFDADGNGSVIAESRTADVQSFMGLRFPGTDIPKQARRLYVLDWTRQVVDVDAMAVPLTPNENPVLGRPLNMALCQLRSVSPIHLEYLRNMRVAASFSISVIVEDELVGLIACHHSEPKAIPFARRQACELIGRHLSQRVEYLNAVVERETKTRRLGTQVELLSRLTGAEGLTAQNSAWSEIRGFLNANAFVVSLNGERAVVPSDFSIDQSVWGVGRVLAESSNERCHAVTSMTTVQDAAASGGLLVVPVVGAGWLGWYREPVDQMVLWAGKPEADGAKDLSPRKSFDAYREVMREQCEAWSSEDVNVAEILRRGLAARFSHQEVEADSFEQVLGHMREYVSLLEDTNRDLSSVNEDLRQFAYAASHDFKAPLRTIRSFLPLIQRDLAEVPERTRSWFEYVNDAADSLHRLQNGLWAFSRVNRETAFTTVDLGEIVKRVLGSLAADLGDAKVTVGPMPRVYCVSEQIETVLRNLTENASKYRAQARPLKIGINASREATGWLISVSDNGIGFPPSAQNKVFELFSRLHTEHRDGDGLGLALCRRILNHHRGWIAAESDPGQGTTFRFLLPNGDRGVA